MFYDHKPIPMNIASKVLRCVCKTKIIFKDYTGINTGFFFRASDGSKFLIPGFMSLKNINENIYFEIWNKKIMNLTFNDRFIKNFESPINTAVIEIKETDSIYNDIDFLDYDPNYQKGYEIYKEANIFSIHFPSGKEAACASGKVIEIDKKYYEIGHNIPTERGSGSCPILLLSDNINEIKVIGFHYAKDIKRKLGLATFIGPIIDELKKSFKKENKPKVFNGINIINFNIDNNMNNINNINSNKIFNPNNPRVNNLINYNNKIQPFNNNFNNIKGNYIQHLNNNNSNIAAVNNNNPLFSSNNSNNSIKSQNEKVLVLANDPNEAITLHFRSSNQLIKYAIRCKTHHKFNLIVNQIFEREPNIVENGLLFLCCGRKINEYKSIKDNQLKDGDAIIIQIME